MAIVKKQDNAQQENFYNQKVEITEMRIEVLDFLESEHNSLATKKYLTSARNAEKELHQFYLYTSGIRKQSGGCLIDKDEQDRYEELKKDLVDLQKILAADFAQKKNEESSDWVKNASYITASTLAVITVFKEQPNIKTAFLAVAGATIGVCIVSHKKIEKTFRSAARNVTKRLSIMKEKVREQNAGKCVEVYLEKIRCPLHEAKKLIVVALKRMGPKL